MVPNQTRTVFAAIVLVAFALAGCDRGTGSATTTVIQQPQAASSASATQSPAKPAITPISDPKELCHQARTLSRKLLVVISPYWKLMVNAHGKDVTDPEISAAADKVQPVAEEAIPKLQGMVAPDAPSDIANAVKDYANAAKNFTDAISEAAANDDQTALASKFGTADENLDSVCKASG